MTEHQTTDGEVLRNLGMLALLLTMFMICLGISLMLFL